MLSTDGWIGCSDDEVALQPADSMASDMSFPSDTDSISGVCPACIHALTSQQQLHGRVRVAARCARPRSMSPCVCRSRLFRMTLREPPGLRANPQPGMILKAMIGMPLVRCPSFSQPGALCPACQLKFCTWLVNLHLHWCRRYCFDWTTNMVCCLRILEYVQRRSGMQQSWQQLQHA